MLGTFPAGGWLGMFANSGKKAETGGKTPSVTLAGSRATVSLRLGHGAALAAHWAAIHYRAAASLPKEEVKVTFH